MVVAITSLGGSKEKRSPPKNDTPTIREARGLESLPQAKVIILEDSCSQGEG